MTSDRARPNALTPARGDFRPRSVVTDARGDIPPHAPMFCDRHGHTWIVYARLPLTGAEKVVCYYCGNTWIRARTFRGPLHP